MTVHGEETIELQKDGPLEWKKWWTGRDSSSSDNVIFFVGIIVLIVFVIILMGVLIDRTHSK